MPAALLLGAALVLGACGGDDGGISTPGGVFDRPTGRDEVVLQVSTGGGYVPLESVLSQTPEYTLYGDGTVITLGPQIEIYPPPALTPLQHAALTDEDIDELLTGADDAGLVRDPQLDYGTPSVTDLPTTTVTVNPDGTDYFTSVYALGYDEGVDLTSEQERARDTLSGYLNTLTGTASDPYEPQGYGVFVLPYVTDGLEQELVQEPVDWPFDDLADATVTNGSTPCVTVTGDDAAELGELAGTTNTQTPWMSNGEQYLLVFRSLLPHEAGCDDLFGGSDTAIEHPTGADEVVVRIASGVGGFGGGTDYIAAGVANVAVYGDGRVVVVGDPTVPDDRTSLPNLQTLQLTDAGIEEVLALLDREGLLVTDPDFGEPFITDQPYTDVTLSAGGVAYDTSIYALDYSDEGELDPEQRELRNGLIRVLAQLTDADFLTDQASGPAEPFTGEGLVVTATPDASDEVLDSVVWPVDAGLGAECVVLTGDDAVAVRELARTTPVETLWLADGVPYRLSMRPLYPEESGCSDLVPPAVAGGA